MSAAAKADLIRWLGADIARATGRSYLIDFAALEVESLREFQRLLRDLDGERRSAVNRVRIEPRRR